jgi:1-acyl-sn-glycerol-3-phosphate acyltransferase
VRAVAPDPPPEVPRRGSVLLRTIGRGVLRLIGWRVVGEVPALPRFVAIVAPHTSNWDFVVGVFVMFALDLRVVWLGKDSLFATPLGPLLRALGGLPVKRDTPEGAVGQIAAMLHDEPRFILALAPEGTRRPVPEWRTGFYRLAEATRVPILPVWLDWSRREAGLGTLLMPTGAMARDVAVLKRSYRAEMGRFPENYAISADARRG